LKKGYKLECFLVTGSQFYSEEELKDGLTEYASLASTLGFNVMGQQIFNLKKINPSTYYGKGQLESIKRKASLLNCRYVFFNEEISPSQFKNIQKLLTKKIVIFDRTGIILEIFKNNAKTKESKYQVELASLQYMLPRLTRQWTHLERQMGGVGTRGGPGEKQIEIDRRLIRNKITKLRKELVVIKKNREVQSAGRDNSFRASIVGYTNAGKSSLLNAICKPDSTYVENKLFATLDTTTRAFSIDKNTNALITDTVGFIKKLPHSLVASFRSTFEEVDKSDLILIIVDGSESRKVISEHISTVKFTLDDMSIKLKNFILVFNKIDQIKNKEKMSFLKKKYSDAIFVSAKEHIMVDYLKKQILNFINKDFISRTIVLKHDKSSLLKNIYRMFQVDSRDDGYKFIRIKVRGRKEDFNFIDKLIET